MSGPFAGGALAEAERARPETYGGILGLGVGLAVLLAAVLATLAPRPPAPAADTWLRERFDVRGIAPHGLVEAPGERFLNGQTVVRLVAPDAPEELPADPPPKGMGGMGMGGPGGGGPGGGPGGGFGGGGGPHGGGGGFGGMGKGGPPGFDWSTVAIGPAGAPPVEAAFVEYAKKASVQVLRDQFGGVRFRGVHEIPGFGGEMPIDSGFLDWSGYEAAYVHLRLYEKVGGEPRFHDVVRVNLTLGERGTVLHVRWPRGVAGSLEPVKELLATYGPR